MLETSKLIDGTQAKELDKMCEQYNDASCIISDNEKQIHNVFDYYVYRYYLKAINDFDVYSRCYFILFSVLSSAFVAIANNCSFSYAARKYSKEIEHSTENIDILLEKIFEL